MNILVMCALLAMGLVGRTASALPPPPPVLMHYMPWFEWSRDNGTAGWHWTENLKWETLLQSRRVASHSTPAIGPYSSVDRDVIRYHLGLMKAAGVAGVIVDWYGTRDKHDYVHPNLLAADAIIDEASKMGLLFTICYEDYILVIDQLDAGELQWGQEPTGEPLQAARAQLRRDLVYVRDNYASKPGFLREDNGAAGNAAHGRVLKEEESDEMPPGMSGWGGEEIVHCPGMKPSQYCDCQGDCTGIPEYCACPDALQCCDGATPTVLCEGQAPDNYCDCGGDCTARSEWCQCAEAQEQECCGVAPPNRPVMLVFGPRNMKSDVEWTSALAEVFPHAGTRPKLLALPGNKNGGPRVGDGAFSWFPPLASEEDLGGQDEVLAGVHEHLRSFYEQSKGTLHMGSVFTGFHDYYQQGRGTASYGRLPQYDGHTFEATMYQARLHQPTFVQAATWNDWEEGTALEPGEGYAHYFLLKLQAHILGISRPADFVAISDAYRIIKGDDYGWPPVVA